MAQEKAIVIGAGIAGLVSARVLADHFSKVTLIEADRLTDAATLRPGVAQGRHTHNLLPGGWDILRALFPALESRLNDAGGIAARPEQWYALTPHGKTYRLSRFQPTPIARDGPSSDVRLQTRGLLEQSIRREVTALSNVEIMSAAAVTDPIYETGRVVGVELGDIGLRLKSDLVVDASGRRSAALTWLEWLDYPRPSETVVNCDFSYCTAMFKPDRPDRFTDGGFLTSSTRDGPYTKRGGALARVEDGNWLVTLAGRLGDHPPRSIDGFHDFVATLHHPMLGELLDDAQLISGPVRYLFPKSVRRNYQTLTRFPDGFLVIGDALCQINPGYSQGMSVACRQAMALDQLLRARRAAGESLDGLWRPYFERAFEQTRAPWLFAALIDFTKTGTTGDFPRDEKASIAEIKRLNKLSDAGDRDAADLIDSVFDMRRSLSSLQASG